MAVKNILSPLDYDQDTIGRRAQSAISKGQVCKYHTDFIQVVPLAASDLLDLACGVALEGAAAGATLRLVKSGVVQTLINGTTAVAVGDRLVASGSEAGVCIKDAAVAVADVNNTIVALEAQATAAATLTYCKVSV